MQHDIMESDERAVCPDDGKLHCFLAAQLSDEENEALESHLDQCEPCRERLETLERKGAGRLNERFRRTSAGGTSLLDRESQKNLIELLGSPEKIQEIPEPEFSLPDRIGQYEILERLGAGGMGVVLKAKHVHLKREVALKLVKSAGRFHAQAIARFYREIEAIGKLDHANIVRASDAGVDQDDQPYLIMELLEGRDVESLVQSRRLLPVEAACKIIRQAAMGLDQVHRAGLIHRDIKPSNLFLTKGGIIKLLDLGLARLYENGAAEEEKTVALEDMPPAGKEDHATVSFLTTRFTVVGSPHFIAPEQIEQSNAVDARADIYSLGCTFFFLLTGKTPYSGTQTEILGSHLRGAFPSVRTYRDDIPPQLENLIRMMTVRNPHDRIASAREIVELLGKLISSSKQGLPSMQVPPLPPSLPPLPPPVLAAKGDLKSLLSRPLVRFSLAAILLLVTVVFGFLGGKHASSSSENAPSAAKNGHE